MLASSSSVSAFDVLVLGDCNPDLLLSGEDVEPRFGQVERLVEAAELTIGGSGAIFACATAKLGLRTAICGVVGDDPFGHFMIDALAREGVDTRGVLVDAAQRTGVTVVLARREDRALLTFPGAISRQRADAIDMELVRSARHVHVSSFFLQTGLARGLPALFAQARAFGTSTSVDPNWDPQERWDGTLSDVLLRTDLFLPNAAEAMNISGGRDPREAARALAGISGTVIVKLGARGALAACGGTLIDVPPVSMVEAIDSTGAGDSFDAGVIAGLLDGLPLEDMVSLGCACGALSTRRQGGTGAQPSRAEALAALEAPR